MAQLTPLTDDELKKVQGSQQQLSPLTDDELDRMQQGQAEQTLFQQSVQSGSPGRFRSAVDPIVATMQGNLMNLGRGAENSLLQVLQRFHMPQGVGRAFAGGAPNLPKGPVISPEQAEPIIAENRRQASLTNELLEAIGEEDPVRAFTGDAMTFVAEMVLSGPQFSSPNRARQLFGRMIQEGTTGAAFGAMTVQADDSLKATAVTTGLLTGAITPVMFDRIAARFRFDPRDRQLILDRLRAEKMFQRQGLLTFGELTGTQTALKTESMLDNIIFIGLGKKRKEQRNQITDIAESIVDQITRGQGREGRRQVVNRVAANLERRFQGNMNLVNRKFDEIGQILDNLPEGSVAKIQPTRMIEEARRLLDQELSKIPSEQNAQFISRLQKVIKNPPVSFRGARETASSLAESARMARVAASRAELNKTAAGAEERLTAAFMSDIDEWARTTGGPAGQAALQRWNEAKDLFKNRILPFYRAEGPIMDAAQGRLSSHSMDDLVGSFFAADRPLRTRANMQLLFKEDQQAIKYLVLRDAMSNAMEAGQLNPTKFAQELRTLSEALGETDRTGQQAVRRLFGPTDSQVIEGFRLLAESAPRASNRAGQQALGTLVATGSIGGAAQLAGGGGGALVLGNILGARFLLTTRAGRKLATTAAELQGTPNQQQQLRALVREAEKGITRWLAIQLSQSPEGVQNTMDAVDLGIGLFRGTQ